MRKLVLEMAQHASGPQSTLSDVACGMHNDLIGRIPAVQDIASLPNPQGRNPHIAEEFYKFTLRRRRRIYLPGFGASAAAMRV